MGNSTPINALREKVAKLFCDLPDDPATRIGSLQALKSAFDAAISRAEAGMPPTPESRT